MARHAVAAVGAALALIAGGCGDEAPAERPASPTIPGLPSQVLEQLRDGRGVLVFRHGVTDNASFQQEVLGDCARQRNLTVKGRAQLRRIGRAMETAGIPVGDVRASPMCRTRDTAQELFGRVTVDRRLVTPGLVGEESDDRRRVRILRRLADTPPSGRGNTVLVTHTGNIGGAFDNESVLEAGALVFAPDGDGRPDLVARIAPDAWEALAPG